MVIIKGLDIVLFVLLSINVLYLLVFSLASCFKKKHKTISATYNRRIVVLIPAYQEDSVIKECVESCLNQYYSLNLYDVVVISDHMSDETNKELAKLPIRLIIAQFDNSTKAKALNLAMSQLEGYDIALILDADNVIGPGFLTQINNAFESPLNHVYQAHRTAKNKNTNLAVLDAVSEEINNSIFRLGHVNLGLSSALIGSGMAFDYELLKTELAQINAIGGFDRALELCLFKKNKRVGYLPEADVLDEKVQDRQNFSRQRRRWMSAQVHYLTESFRDMPEALRSGNIDFCDKLFQHTLFPRVILVGLILIISVIMTIFIPSFSVKWWWLFGLLILALLLAIPLNLYTVSLLKAAFSLPATFLSMFFNLFRLKGANKKFIHTKHGVK